MNPLLSTNPAPSRPRSSAGPLKVVLGLFVLVAVPCIAAILVVQTAFVDRIVPAERPDLVGVADAIMVLGASVKSDGTPSDALRDRLMTGLDLYKAGKAPEILITGDDGGFRADEIDVMRRFLVDQGVPSSTVRVDGEGYRTYESCKRAKEEGIRRVIVVTQRFHLARALYLCNRLGVDAQGVIADRQTYVRIVYFWTRDLLSSAKAWWDVNVLPPKSPVDAR